jgi:tetratricopeptide (TPR) repeat protein
MQAIAISEKIQDRNGQATYLHNFGAVLKESGELEQSVDYFTRALEIRREIHDYAGMKETLYNLALTLDELGSGKLAVELLREVISLDEQFDFPTSTRDKNALINFSEKHRGDVNENP